MINRIRIVHLGIGPIGASLVRLAATRPRLQIVGAVDVDPGKVGRDLGEVANLPRPMGVKIGSNLAAVLAETVPDVVVQATSSSLIRIAPELEMAMSAGARVVSSSEELVYPYHRHPQLAARLDGIAKVHGSAVLGTGINPGFAMDTLPLLITGVCEHVEHISVKRVQEAGNRRLPLQLKVGAGITVDEFQARVRTGAIGHVGMRESAAMIADAIGWDLESIEETINPVVADRSQRSAHLEVPAGRVTGIDQILSARSGGREVVRLELLMHIGTAEPLDRIDILGMPPVHVVIPGGFLGDPATAAVLINSIPRVMSAPPGLHSILDLPPIHSVAS